MPKLEFWFHVVTPREVGIGVGKRPRSLAAESVTSTVPDTFSRAQLALPLGALLATERALADPAATALAAMILVLTRLVLPGTQGHGAPRLLAGMERTRGGMVRHRPLTKNLANRAGSRFVSVIDHRRLRPEPSTADRGRFLF